MKTLAWVGALALLLALPAAHAQQVLARAASAPPPPGSALPPPSMNDPGEQPQSVPLPNTGIPPSMAPAAREAEGHGDSTNVTSRTDANGDKIEEFRRSGSVYMVRITPKFGVPQTFHVDSTSGSLVRNPDEGPVSPVYYTIFKWGKGGEPVSGSTAPAAPIPPPPQMPAAQAPASSSR